MNDLLLINVVLACVVLSSCSEDRADIKMANDLRKPQTMPFQSHPLAVIPFIYTSRIMVTHERCLGRGGVLLNVGYDTNFNHRVDPQESRGEEVLCDGDNGEKALINSSSIDAGDSCPVGGIIIDRGIDRNNDGVLLGREVISRNRLCHVKRANIAIIFPLPGSNINIESKVFLLYLDADSSLDAVSIKLNEKEVKHFFARNMDTSELVASITSLRPFLIEKGTNKLEVRVSGEHLHVNFDA